MKLASLCTRGLIALALSFTAAVSAVAIPSSDHADTSLIVRASRTPMVYQRSSAPMAGQWMGSNALTIGGSVPYHLAIVGGSSMIDKIRVYHSKSRIWKIQVEYQNGTTMARGSTDWGASSSVWETYDLLADEVITYIHVEKDSREPNKITGLRFQSNKGYWSPYFGRDRSKNLPIGLSTTDYYVRHSNNIGTVRYRDASPGEDYYGSMQHITGFEFIMWGSNVGLVAIMPLWSDHSTQIRKILDQPSDAFVGQNLEGYEGWFTDAEEAVLSYKKLDRVSLRKITLWFSGWYITSIKLTWSDGVETFEGPRRGVVGDRSKTFEFAENEFVVGVRYIGSDYRRPNSIRVGGVIQMQFIYDRYNIEANGDITKEQFITAAFGHSNPPTHGNIYEGSWEAPSSASSLIGFAGLWARPNGIASQDKIRALRPLWIQDGPIKSHLIIEHVDHGILVETEGTIEGANFQTQNPGPTCLINVASWTYTSITSNELSVSSSSLVTSGHSSELGISTSVSVEGGGFGITVGATTETSLSYTAFTEVANERSTGNTWTTEKSVEGEYSVTCNVPPYVAFYSCRVVLSEAEVADSEWTGTLHLTYRDGTVEAVPVSGSFKGYESGHTIRTLVDYVPMEGHEGTGCGSSRNAGQDSTVYTKWESEEELKAALGLE